MNEQVVHYEAKLAYEMDSWDLQDAVERGEAITVVDARSAAAYAKEHIPGAISFPHRTMTAETTEALDQGRIHVVYCDGIGCNASTKGALNLARLGFKVRELIGGLDWWKRDGYSTERGGDDSGPGAPACGCG